MKLYYVDKNPIKNNQHELHIATCSVLPNIFHRKYLGQYQTLTEANRYAKKHFENTVNCIHCIQQTIETPIPFYKRWFNKK